MREVVPGVLTWAWFSEPHGYDFNGTLVLHEEGNLCIDPVEPAEGVLDQLAERGVAQILISNRNHARAANDVRERTGARVAIHPADAAYAKEQGLQIDAELVVGQRVGPFSIVGVPGKSPGEIVLHDAARRLLIMGDALIGNPPGELSLLRDRVLDDPGLLRRSVRGLLELDFDTVLVGDGVPILEGGREQLRALIGRLPPD